MIKKIFFLTIIQKQNKTIRAYTCTLNYLLGLVLALMISYTNRRFLVIAFSYCLLLLIVSLKDNSRTLCQTVHKHLMGSSGGLQCRTSYLKIKGLYECRQNANRMLHTFYTRVPIKYGKYGNYMKNRPIS